ncbi:CREB-regulated transcription coactivator 3 isoform X1 [Rhinichthys klamathensis goyatoka]|uniref:CREB-regulated transcription coactivator 3 isoform X1 n=1 Tax=Rhinichthys klamathensis goyatoka TaxID=3034132 RepID=UPI0024B50171|nr:CREB-regulated transcription coactivator 3 isoform X1 [Rhinichthys klamathensis goyatoka]XP_056114992.1 CREB-regulated transcription coactivator 3 isoform X1 [Rhinichthys klamathensis goyatoka]XP_056114993.1 CREB-regulated transcription coactivator 3 isoform X1 [Rhinichthys klamathensis goyatoka]
MSGSPGSSGSNPRKFSEKIALHNQKQAEETRAFEQLMTDLTVSRVQFQKIQQLRLSQNRAQYYGGSLPNVNQIGNASTDFQGVFPSGLDSVRGTRHHGLVERVHRDRNRINSPHRRPIDKHGRQAESSPYGTMYLSPPPDNSWRREQLPWTEEKRPGFRLISQLNRTNSDSALHTSAMSPNPQDPFGMNQQMGRGPPQRNASMNEAEVDNAGDVFSFPAVPNEDNLLGVNKPLPKQLWEAKKVQSLSSRPKSCEVPGINIFPSPEQNAGLSHYQGTLNTGGSLPDLSNLHFPSPLPTPLDPDEAGYPNLSGGSSTGNLPAAMMHLGIGNSQGLSSSLSNPSIQASLNNSQLHSSLSNPSLHTSLRLSSLSNPPPTGMASSPRRRPAPISPLTLSPGGDQRRSLSKQLSPTMSPSLSPITQQFALEEILSYSSAAGHFCGNVCCSSAVISGYQEPGVALDTSNLPMEPPPPYPHYQQTQQQQPPQSHQSIQQSSQHPGVQQRQTGGQQQQQQHQQHQPVSPLQNVPLDFNSSAHNSMAAFFNDPFMELQFSGRQSKCSSYQDQYNMLENVMSSVAGGFDPSSNLYCSQAALMGLGGSHGNLQDHHQMRHNMLYSNCGGGVPNIILTDDSNPNLSKDISSVLSAVPECLDSEGGFPLEDELRIEPLSLDGLSMLSDPDMVLPDPSVEDSFRSDRL